MSPSWARLSAALLLSAAAGCKFDRPADVLGPSDAAPDAPECVAGTAVCLDNISRVCSDEGLQLPDESCALGCRAATGRCERLDASNGLNAYLDRGRARPGVDLRPAATINTSTGAVSVGGVPVEVETVLLDAPVDGVAVRVIIGHDFQIGDVIVSGTPALALVAPGPVIVDGIIDLAGRPGISGPGGTGLGAGNTNLSGPDTRGPGGGGFGSIGGAGGLGSGIPDRVSGGEASSATDLEPLRGGGNGGERWVDTTSLLPGGGGGGALQVSSETSISIRGGLDASGGAAMATGGGAGGGLLLEAPTLVVDAFMVAGGGGGGSFCGTPGVGESGRRDGIAAAGAPACAGGAAAAGGAGALSLASPGGRGGDGSSSGGSGGGGHGRIVWKTVTGGSSASPSSLFVPPVRVGTLRVRP